MERRWSGDSAPKAPKSLQRKLAESRKPAPTLLQHKSPDLADFMNDVFSGTTERKPFNLSGNSADYGRDDYDDFDSSTRSNSSSRSTQEWLEEARRLVASSPSQRCDPPGKRVVSPRFAAAAERRVSVSSLDRRDPLSRSARRHRKVDSFSEEILNKSTAKHSRNPSDTTSLSAVTTPDSPFGSPPNTLPPRSSTLRRSRFRVPDQPDAPAQPPTLLSPPKDTTAFQRSASSSLSAAAFASDDQAGGVGGNVLSPPRRIVESVHRRSVSSSTCSVDRDSVGGGLKMISKGDFANDFSVDSGVNEDRDKDKEKEGRLNAFLKDNRRKAEEVLCGARDARINIVLSGPSNSTTSMVAAICYTWLLENRLSKKKGENNGRGPIVVPVMNVKRIRMWKLRQAAWLFNHVGLDATSLFFADEVDLESLMMEGKLSIHVIGQDVLKSNSEIKSLCTILTDNYCEEAYELLQNSMLKKLLLAGILLDTQSLSTMPKLSTVRDAEAVQLLLVNAAPNYRNTLFDQLTKDHQDNDFVEELQLSYGKISDDGKFDSKESARSSKKSAPVRSEVIKKEPDMKPQETVNAKANKISPNSDKQTAPQKQGKAPDSGRGKGVFFLARWFGFGPK